jgi:hypothetical protein
MALRGHFFCLMALVLGITGDISDTFNFYARTLLDIHLYSLSEKYTQTHTLRHTTHGGFFILTTPAKPR